MQVRRHNARMATLAFGTALVVASLVPASGAPAQAAVAGPFAGIGLDKVLHAGGFLVLTVLALADVNDRRWTIGAVVGIVLLGVGIEFAQIGVGGRAFEVADMVADAVGVAAGLVVLRWRR